MITQCSQFQQVLQGSFDLAHLCKIHSHLFQDVYEWVGEVIRVDIIRGDSRFCNVRQIQFYANTIFSSLPAEKYLVNLEPAVNDLGDMTKVIHPRNFFVNIKLREELAAYAAQAKCVDRSYPFFAS